jgi:hypothetical protein
MKREVTDRPAKVCPLQLSFFDQERPVTEEMPQESQRVEEILKAAECYMKERKGKPASWTMYEKFKNELTEYGRIWLDDYDKIIGRLTKILKR